MTAKKSFRPRALAALFPRLAPGEFAEKYFPNRPFVAHGPLSRLGDLGRDPRLSDPAAIIEAANNPIVLGYLTTASGRRHQAHMTKATAQEMFKDGVTVDASSLELTMDVVGRWAASLRAELGLRPNQNHV